MKFVGPIKVQKKVDRALLKNRGRGVLFPGLSSAWPRDFA